MWRSHIQSCLSRARQFFLAPTVHTALKSGEETYPIYVMIHFQDRLSFASLWNIMVLVPGQESLRLSSANGAVTFEYCWRLQSFFAVQVTSGKFGTSEQ